MLDMVNGYEYAILVLCRNDELWHIACALITDNYSNVGLCGRRGLIFLSVTLPFLFPSQEYVKDFNVEAEEWVHALLVLLIMLNGSWDVSILFRPFFIIYIYVFQHSLWNLDTALKVS